VSPSIPHTPPVRRSRALFSDLGVNSRALERVCVWVPDSTDRKTRIAEHSPKDWFLSTPARLKPPWLTVHSPNLHPSPVSASLPVELQRVVHTIKDIDERQSRLRGDTKQRVDVCLAMPSASSRQASEKDIETTTNARAEIEKNHHDINQLSLEKVRLAQIALEMIQYNIRDLDAELAPFTEEMKLQNEAGFDDEFAVDADGMDLAGFGEEQDCAPHTGGTQHAAPAKKVRVAFPKSRLHVFRLSKVIT
jgi:hypothetical protein